MPYVLAPTIKKSLQGLWQEGSPYTSKVIYDICDPDPKKPPVHYEAHTLKPHSICHFDAPAHIVAGEPTIDKLFSTSPSIFYGPVLIVRLKKQNFMPRPRQNNWSHWEVTKEEILDASEGYNFLNLQKIFLTFDGAEEDFYINPNRAFTISSEAAKWLTSLRKFNLFGTIWRSTDFQPDSRERPIHIELFKRAGILECLDLSKVPSGEYYLSAFPLPIEGASESPVCPVLYSKNEISCN